MLTPIATLAKTALLIFLLGTTLAACTGHGPKPEDQHWFDCRYECG